MQWTLYNSSNSSIIYKRFINKIIENSFSKYLDFPTLTLLIFYFTIKKILYITSTIVDNLVYHNIFTFEKKIDLNAKNITNITNSLYFNNWITSKQMLGNTFNVKF